MSSIVSLEWFCSDSFEETDHLEVDHSNWSFLVY